MTAKGYIFGHEVYWDESVGGYRYMDNDLLAHHWGGSPRPCPQCQEYPTEEGHDPCIGHIEGVYSACCGHGVENGYILWDALRDPPLRRMRQERGLTLRDVVADLGISLAYLSELERGIASPSLKVARDLAAFFGVAVDELFPVEQESNQ